MKLDIIFFCVLSLLCAAISYFVSESVLFPAVIAPVYLLAFLFLLRPSLFQGMRKERIAHETFVFVDAFLISLSVTGSLERAYESSYEKSSGDLRARLDSLSHQSVPDRLKSLQEYFDSNRYRMFLSLFDLYQEQGGDALRISSNLLAELTRVEENALRKRKESFASLFQYGVLWTMSLGILCFLRFGLANFFASLTQSGLYLLCLAVYFVFFLVSILAFGFCFYGEKPSIRWNRRTHESSPS